MVIHGTECRALETQTIRFSRLLLYVTDACNLDCVYCYVKQNVPVSNRVMSWEVFTRGIDFFLSQIHADQNIHINFFGGEPTLYPRFIQNAVAHLETLSKNKPFEFSHGIFTNGTQMDDPFLDFLIRKKFSVMMSLDGPKTVHDANRPFKNGRGSFDTVLANLKKAAQFIPVAARMTVSDFSLDIVDALRRLHQAGSRNILIKPAIDRNHRTENPDFLNRQIERFFDKIGDFALSRLKNRNWVPYSALIDRLTRIHRGSAGPKKGWPCDAGDRSFTLSTDGNIYLCHRLHPLEAFRMGDIWRGIDRTKRTEFFDGRMAAKRDMRCDECFAENLCGGVCYHTSHVAKGDRDIETALHCSFERALLRCALKIYVSLPPERRALFDTPCQ